MSGEQDEDREISDSVSDSLKFSFSLFIDLRVGPHSGERMKSMPKVSFDCEMSMMVCERSYQLERQNPTDELTHLPPPPQVTVIRRSTRSDPPPFSR